MTEVRRHLCRNAALVCLVSSGQILQINILFFFLLLFFLLGVSNLLRKKNIYGKMQENNMPVIYHFKGSLHVSTVHMYRPHTHTLVEHFAQL